MGLFEAGTRDLLIVMCNQRSVVAVAFTLLLLSLQYSVHRPLVVEASLLDSFQGFPLEASPWIIVMIVIRYFVMSEGGPHQVPAEVLLHLL